MTSGYHKGKIVIVFKPEARLSELEKVLMQYSYEKTFDMTPSEHWTDREEERLARTYHLTVPLGTEMKTTVYLMQKYPDVVEWAEIIPIRKLH